MRGVWYVKAATPRRSAAHESELKAGLGLEAAQAIPAQIDQVSGDLGLLGLADIDPPLSGERHHADQHL